VSLPDVITTERLLLRRWQPTDAPRLKAALDASVAHLEPWIPWAIAEPASVPELEARLAGHVADFDAGRAWIYGIFPPDEGEVLGAVGLYPRDAVERVPIAAADRVELGYWLHVGATGRGYATEATVAAAALGETLPSIAHLEIRCDPRNAPSAAVPRRLGFTHQATIQRPASAPDAEPRELLIWVRPVAR
jgi:RimJ/RimL family protein N-acetyltransferase